METLSIALREDFRATKDYTKPTIVTVARSPGSEPMEIDAIKSSGDRRRATQHKSDVRTGRLMVCFRCRKTGHRAAECRASALISAHKVSTNSEGTALAARLKSDQYQ